MLCNLCAMNERARTGVRPVRASKLLVEAGPCLRTDKSVVQSQSYMMSGVAVVFYIAAACAACTEVEAPRYKLRGRSLA